MTNGAHVIISSQEISRQEVIIQSSNKVSDDCLDVCKQNSSPEDQSYNESRNEDPIIQTLSKLRKDSPNNIIISHVNINSIKHKFEYFHEILTEGFLDILCLTETKLDDTYSKSLFQCNGYKCYRKDLNAKSGGIMVLIRDDIPQTRKHDYEFSHTTDHVESMIFEITVKSFKFNLFVTYKNPKVSSEKFICLISQTYDALSSNSNESILVGDVNINMINEDNVFENNICNVYGLTNLIQSPTCFKSEVGTLLDPVVVSNTQKFCKPFNITCGSSDFHNIVGCMTRTTLPKSKPYRINYRSFKGFDETKFRNAVENLPMQICEIFDETDDQYWVFSKLYYDVLNEHAPLKSKTVSRKKVPYMTSDLMKEMYKRNRLKNIFFKYRCKENWENYKRQRNKVTSLRRSAIKQYFMTNCKKPNVSPKDFWKCIKPFFSNSCHKDNNIILQVDDQIVSDPNVVCDTLNEYFVTMADDIAEDQLFTHSSELSDHKSMETIQNIVKDKVDVNVSSPSQFKFKCVTYDYVAKRLKGVKCNKSTGFDNVPPKAVKICSAGLSGSMAFIINNSFENNTFPNDMKKAEITPVFKKKCPLQKENYRPINIVGVFSKIFESIIAEQIDEYMSCYFNDMLGAYRKGHGCNHVLTFAVDTWKRALDKSECIATLFMDLSRAFDSIPHDLLIAKLMAYGFSNNACYFMSSYMKDRQQRVKLKHFRSSWLKTKKGIPQGSCLGPLLFNVFINDIFPNIVKCNIFNYADDNSLSISDVNLENAVANLIGDTNIAIQWFEENFMKVNPEKFQLMFIIPENNVKDVPLQIAVNDECILKPNMEVKLLGVTIDCKLNFDPHVKEICKKASRQLKVLFRMKSLLGRSEKKIIFETFIVSCFNFCPIVWNFCGKSSMQTIEKIQERALRFVYDDSESSYSELLKKSGKCTMHVSRIKLFAMEMFKCINKLNPMFLNDIVIEKRMCKDFRDPSIMKIPKFNKIKYGKKTFSYYGPHIWNQLPVILKDNLDFMTFKKLLSTWNGPTCTCNCCNL